MSTLLLVALDFKSDEPITEPCVYRMKGHSASQRVRFVPLPSRPPPRALSVCPVGFRCANRCTNSTRAETLETCTNSIRSECQTRSRRVLRIRSKRCSCCQKHSHGRIAERLLTRFSLHSHPPRIHFQLQINPRDKNKILPLLVQLHTAGMSIPTRTRAARHTLIICTRADISQSARQG